MRVLVATNMYPTAENPAFGVFVKDQVESLRRAGAEVDLYFVNGRKSAWNYALAALSFWRYLRGRVWIDDQDLQVVKVAGQALPEQSAHRTPKFETFFQNVDQYWFPSYVAADDTVRMGKYSTRVVVKIHFTTYKRVTKRG